MSSDASQTPSRAPDPIPPELERELFKRFWTWLAIVGTVVVAVVSGFSIVAAQAINSAINERFDAKLDNLEKRSLDTVDKIQQAVLDAALNARDAQQKSIGEAEGAKKAADGARKSADAAQTAAQELDNKIKSLPDVNVLLKDTDAIVNNLIHRKEFVERINGEIADRVQAFDKTLNIGRILAVIEVRAGKPVLTSNGATFDQSTGVLTFPNPTNSRFVPLVSYISPNNAYATETIFVKTSGQNFVTIWQGAQDTSGRNHPPTDFTAVVVGF